MKPCLFCSKLEHKTDGEYVCGSCVQLLLCADQEDLKRAYDLALKMDYKRKAFAIESFLIPEDKAYEQRKPATKIRRDFNRIRIARPARNKKERIGRTQAEAEVAVL